MSDHRLDALYEQCNKAIKSAIRMRRKIDGAINWADLHCIQAEKYETNDGVQGFRVWIEEASPDATELCSYVWRKLKAAGWNNLEVRTEW